MYKELNGVVNNAADTYWDPVTQSAYFYDGNNFYGGESLQSIQARADYAHCNGLGGFMMFSLYDLDPGTTLFNAAVNDINGSAGSCPSSSGSPSPPPETVPVWLPGLVTETVSASDSAGKSLTYSATGLPAGLSISSAGLISGTPTTAATSNVTVTASSGTASGSASFTWTVNAQGTGGGALTNGGFESGSLSPWTCQAGSSVVSSPVHTGSYAALITPTSNTTGECDQTVTLQPNHSYTLTGWVQGPYAYVGVSGGASASTWSSTTSWNKLTVSFTTGSSGTVTVYVHGWYAQGNVNADDFSVS
jgi:chitinase